MREKPFTKPVLLMIAMTVFAFSLEATGDETVSNRGGNTITVENFTMEWSIDGETLTVTATAPTTGWVAVGFDPSAAMKDANIIIAWVQEGELHVRDDYGSGHISHSPDEELGGTSDVAGISGTEENGTTRIVFTIPLDSRDRYDAPLLRGNTHKVILACGADGADDFTSAHVWAKSLSLEL